MRKYNFNIDGAMKILRFSITDLNKNLEINNHLFKKDISKKLLGKLKKLITITKNL